MIVARVRRTLRERGLLQPGVRVLAACSGGPDSAAMLVALAQLQSELDFTLEAASVDHGLRPDAARDVELARAQAERAGVAFHALRVHVDANGSLQAAARDARYAALWALAQRIDAGRLAIGHTRDDQAETVLLRVLRGAGLLGLAGIEPLRPDGVIRPLIDCDRAAVADFAVRYCPAVATDPSNRDVRFTRARVRAELLPALAREDPAIIEHLCDLSEDARALRDALLPQARAALESSTQEPAIIDISRLTASPSAIVRLALRLWLEPQIDAELGRSHLEQLERAATCGGEVWLPNSWQVHARAGERFELVSSSVPSALSANRASGRKP